MPRLVKAEFSAARKRDLRYLSPPGGRDLAALDHLGLQLGYRLLDVVVVPTLALAALSTLGRAATADELAIGAKAPGFTLLGTDGQKHTLAEYAKPAEGEGPKAIAVVFTCNHCPYAKAYEPVLIDLAHQYADKGVAFVLISPNDPKIAPDDSYEKMQARAKEKNYPFPYLYDESQETAKAYGARVTPHIFLLDSSLVLRYRGRTIVADGRIGA